MIYRISFGEETAMAKYADLKDYLQNEQIHRIRCELDTYIKSKKFNCRVNKLTIKTVRCEDKNNFEVNIIVGVETLLTFEIGNKKEVLYYYNVKLCVDIENSIFDIKDTCIQEVSKDDLIDGDLLNQFMLPDIAKANVEESGESIHCDYSKNAVYDGYMLPVESIIINNGIPVYYSDLPDNCFGRIYFRSATAVVFNKQPYFNKLINMSMKLKPGNIILNKNRYELGIKDDELITIAHELVHWKKHQKYYRLLEILESESEMMSCDTEPIVFDDSITPIQKAHFYAECQADALAFRVAMPKSLVEEALQKIEENSEPYKYKTDYYEDIVKKISQLFGVSRDISKQRLRQLGYDWADSIFLQVNNKYYDSFSFAPGTLKENETFVINRASYKKLLRDDKKFAELIQSKKFVYTGYVVCIYNGKFIKPVREKGEIRYTLSEYGRSNVNKCCLIFERNPETPVNRKIVFYVNEYFCRLNDPDGYVEEDEDGEYILSEDANEDINTFFYERYVVINDMKAKQINTLHDALIYHKERKKLTYDQLSYRCNMNRETIDAYYAKPSSTKFRKCPIEKLMVICNGLELEEIPALDLLKKAGYALNEDVIEGQMYRYLLTITNASLEAWNKILLDVGLKPLS